MIQRYLYITKCDSITKCNTHDPRAFIEFSIVDDVNNIIDDDNQKRNKNLDCH